MRLEHQNKNDRTERLDRSTDACGINGGLLGLIPNDNGLKAFKSIISKQNSEFANMFPTLEITENSPLVLRQEAFRTVNPKTRDRAEGRGADDPNADAIPDWSGVKHKSDGAPDQSGVKDQSGGSQERQGLKDKSGAAPHEPKRVDAKEIKPAWSKYVPIFDSARDEKSTAQLEDIGTLKNNPVGIATREKVELLTQPYKTALGRAVRGHGTVKELRLPDQGYSRTQDQKDSSEQSKEVKIMDVTGKEVHRVRPTDGADRDSSTTPRQPLDSHLSEVSGSYKTPDVIELLEKSDSIIKGAENRVKQLGQ